MQSDPAEQWRRLSEELGRALELSEADRAALLTNLRTSARVMDAELEKLLANCREKGFSQFLEGSVFSVSDSLEQPTLVGRTLTAGATLATAGHPRRIYHRDRTEQTKVRAYG